MRHILIDCDPGHDDALAIMTACANVKKLNILGITTVGGNQTLEKVTKNAQNILRFLDADIPLAKGQAGPLVKEIETAPEAHGESGMDGPYLCGGKYPVSSDNGVVFLYEKIMACEEKVTLVALGPLTNIALLIKVFPEVKDKIVCLSMMGGGLSHGNCTEMAEFNIYVDPEAAHIVFQSGIPIVMAGLDVTEKAVIKFGEIQSLANKGRASNLAYELLSFYHESGKQFGFKDSPIHDLCAVAYLLEPAMFSGTEYFVDVVTDTGKAQGLTFADNRQVPKHEKNTLVLEYVNRERFVDLLMKALLWLDDIGDDNLCWD